MHPAGGGFDKYVFDPTVFERSYAKVYDDSEAAREVEQEYMLERNKIVADGEADAEDEAEEA